MAAIRESLFIGVFRGSTRPRGEIVAVSQKLFEKYGADTGVVNAPVIDGRGNR